MTAVQFGEPFPGATTDAQADKPIGWAMIEDGGPLRLAGYFVEATVGGTKFLALHHEPPVRPDERPLRLINARMVRVITPCSEHAARRIGSRQWR